MKFKYFLRGLGTGIVFSAIVCLVAFMGSDARKISDKEVIERAKELGMIEKQDSVKDMFASEQDKTEESSKNKADKEETTEGKSTEKKTTEEKSTEKKTTEKKTTENKTTEEKTEEEKTTEDKITEEKTSEKESTEDKKEDNTNQIVTITIKGGSTSYPVCQELQKLGVIEDATDFDNYLIKNGYANRISVGTHTLRIGMTYEEIAVAISDPR